MSECIAVVCDHCDVLGEKPRMPNPRTLRAVRCSLCETLWFRRKPRSFRWSKVLKSEDIARIEGQFRIETM